MLRLHHSALIAAAALLTACASTVPAVTLKLDSKPQEAVNAVRDWDKVAARITAELSQRGMLIAPQPGVTPATPPWGPYYVHVLTPGSTFLQSVADSLRTNIVNAGGTVARTPAGAVVINLSVDYVKHGPREQLPGGEFAALGTVIAAGAAIAGGTPYSNPWVAAAVAGGSALAYGILADAYAAQYPSLGGEMMWRASVVSSQQVLMRVGAPVYVPTGDLPLYRGDTTLAEMNTPGTVMAPAVRRMRYDP